MAKKLAPGETSKSDEIRALLLQNPNIKAKEVIDALGKRGVEIKPNLFYFVKGSVEGGKKKSQKSRKSSVAAAVASNVSVPNQPKPVSALATIMKVKGLATDVGGLRTLKQIVDALSE